MGVPIPRQTLWAFDSLDRRLRALEGQLTRLAKHGGDYAEKEASELKAKAAQQLHDSAAAFLKADGLDADSPILGDKATNSDVAVVTTQLSANFDAFRDRHVEKRYGRTFWLVQESGGEVEYVPVSEQAEAPADE